MNVKYSNIKFMYSCFSPSFFRTGSLLILNEQMNLHLQKEHIDVLSPSNLNIYLVCLSGETSTDSKYRSLQQRSSLSGEVPDKTL